MPPVVRKGFRVRAIIRNRIESRKRRVARRLDKFKHSEDLSQPMLRGGAIRYELAGRAVGTACGGGGLMHQLVRELKLAEAIDARLQLFKIHLPYHESDHVLNLAYNALCDGRCLEDLELRRQDEAYLNLLGAARIAELTFRCATCRGSVGGSCVEPHASSMRAPSGNRIHPSTSTQSVTCFRFFGQVILLFWTAPGELSDVESQVAQVR
jgi:hypothetical protein